MSDPGVSDYTPKSSFWTSIKRLALGASVTPDLLYTDGIIKLADMAAWLRDEITKVRAELANVTAGSKATTTGSVDLSTLIYDAIAGDLNGLTFQIQADTGGVKTVTFGTGGSAPTGPADVVSQINTQTSGQPFSFVDAASHLNVQSTTAGSMSTIDIVGGSAVTKLGFTNGQNAAGVVDGADGISKIGGQLVAGTLFTIPGGTLRSMLQYLADNAGNAKLGSAQSWTATQTFQNIVALLAQVAGIYVQQSFEKEHHLVSAAATTYTYATSDGPVVYFDQWNGSGGTMTVTLPNLVSSGSKRYEVEFSFYPTAGTAIIGFQRATGGALFTLVGPAYVKWRWDGTSWRAVVAVPLDGNWGSHYNGPGTSG